MDGCDLEIHLNARQLCDTELICNGGFSPLTGFMTEEEYSSVVEKNRLPNGLLFGLPVVYDTDREDLKAGEFRSYVHIHIYRCGIMCVYICGIMCMPRYLAMLTAPVLCLTQEYSLVLCR